MLQCDCLLLIAQLRLEALEPRRAVHLGLQALKVAWPLAMLSTAQAAHRVVGQGLMSCGCMGGAQAIGHLLQSMRIARETQDHRGEVETAVDLADAYYLLGSEWFEQIGRDPVAAAAAGSNGPESGPKPTVGSGVRTQRHRKLSTRKHSTALPSTASIDELLMPRPPKGRGSVIRSATRVRKVSYMARAGAGHTGGAEVGPGPAPGAGAGAGAGAQTAPAPFIRPTLDHRATGPRRRMVARGAELLHLALPVFSNNPLMRRMTLRVFSSLGRCFMLLAEEQLALASWRQAVQLAEQLGDGFAQAEALEFLGCTLLNLACYQDAIACFTAMQNTAKQVRWNSASHRAGMLLANTYKRYHHVLSADGALQDDGLRGGVRGGSENGGGGHL